jgi:uncharacterized protein (DUF305 family)
MKMKILLAIIVAASFMALACGSGSNTVDHSTMDHGDHSGMQSSPGAADADYDQQFLDTMIAHHQGAIDMARLALAKNSRPDLQSMANSILVSQEKEIAQMKDWRQSWFRGKPFAVNMDFPGMRNSMRGMNMEKLQSLDGPEFDLEFLRQMKPHHEGALVMAKDAQQKSQRPEIKTIAGQIIEGQDREIKQITEWQAAWK